MNELQAKAILICENIPRSVKEIWIRLDNFYGIEITYNHLANTCSLLSIKGLLTRRELNFGGRRKKGNPAYYTASERGKSLAYDWLREDTAKKLIEKTGGNNNANLMRYFKEI